MTEAERQFDKLISRARSLPAEAAVRETREFFRALPPATALALAESRPDQVGGLDGVPASLRYRSNHLRLSAAQARLQAAVEDGTASRRDRVRLGTVREMLSPVKRTGLDESGRLVEVEQHRQFLSVHPQGQGRVVEVIGDLDRARNVAVLVPGMNNSLDSLRELADEARLTQAESGPGTAAVVWLDYESPQGVFNAVGKQTAWDTAPVLRRFRAGLDTEKLPGASVTMIGHSYGSEVLGQGLLRGVRADRVILIGSPGIDPEVRSASDLVSPPTQVFAGRSPGDVVAYTEWHGPDPASFPDVVRLETAGGTPVRWHEQYYRPNSESLRNIGRVVRGDLAAVTTTDTSPADETRLAPSISWAGAVRGAAGTAGVVYDGLAALRGVKAPPRGSVQAPAWTGDSQRPGARQHRPNGPGR